MLQCAFGWQDCHLHEFVRGGYERGTRVCYVDADTLADRIDDFFGEPDSSVTIDEATATLADLYDFGDNWDQTLELVELVDAQGPPARLIRAAERGPAEDSGGAGFRDQGDLLGEVFDSLMNLGVVTQPSRQAPPSVTAHGRAFARIALRG